jgi:transposase-like protein
MSEPGKSPRQFSTAFKEQVVVRLESGEKIGAVAEEIGVKRKLLYQWRDAYRAMGVGGLNRKRGRKVGWRPPPSALPAGELAGAKARIAELEQVIGRQQADLHFFREALRLWDATNPNGVAPTSMRSSKE